ncbi:hypothetical protein BD408DRAFT_413759 [Parasitella parasitica]|nr:hypothetical protein BD408DRAFT_413759 [Parasitella parasitica]
MVDRQGALCEQFHLSHVYSMSLNKSFKTLSRNTVFPCPPYHLSIDIFNNLMENSSFVGQFAISTL